MPASSRFAVLILLTVLQWGVSWSPKRPPPSSLVHSNARYNKVPDFCRRCLVFSVASALTLPTPSQAKCADIETCREIGERRDAELAAANPVIRLGNGLQYKVMSKGLGDDTVSDESKVQIIYTISQSNGSYMYSQGFGFNKIDAGGGKMVNDYGMDTLLINMDRPGEKKIPLGILQSLVGMRRGERRRIQCPPALGFETSDWNPQPTTFRGKQQIKDYRNTLFGESRTMRPVLLRTSHFWSSDGFRCCSKYIYFVLRVRRVSV